MPDEIVLSWFQSHRHLGVTMAMQFVSLVHSTTGLLVIVTLLAAALAWAREARDWIVLLVVGVPGAMLVNVAIKHLVQRARPLLDDPLVVLHTYSFPSGHAAGSSALYTFAALWLLAHIGAQRKLLRGGTLAAAAAMVLWVGVARLYLGVHYLSDVLAGTLLGTTWVLGWATLLRRRQPVSPTLPET